MVKPFVVVHGAAVICLLGAIGGCVVERSPRSDSPVISPTLMHASSHAIAPEPTTLEEDPYPEYNNIATEIRLRPRADKRLRFGPPPPGYWKIVGEPVPNWTPGGGYGDRTGVFSWTFLGPRPISGEYWSGRANASGRVVSIAPHPTNGNICYLASASGGVWKTTDAGMNWNPITDELSILNHGVVALDPVNPNIVYVGTGEYQTNSNGDGLFRSLDAGATWTRIATTSQVGNRCSGIIIDPTNTQRIHVTGSGGYYRSTDGGANWTRILSSACSSISMNPTTPNTLFVGSPNNGVYKSTNGGSSWALLAGGLPTSNIRRTAVVVAPSNPNIVYVAIVNPSSGLLGFYRSSNAGSTWIQKTATPDFPSPQGNYDLFVGVDPANENIVYAGGVFPTYAVAGVIKTTDGGDSWADITVPAGGGQLHPDQQTIAFGPGGVVWIGNDGGVWKSSNGGNSWINMNGNLAVTQNYQVALHPTNAEAAITGTQDNGTIWRTSATQTWPQIRAGDGGFAAFDRNTPSRSYTTYVYLALSRGTNGSGWTNISGPWESDPTNFISPFVMDPTNPLVLVAGTNRVWRTTNASSTPVTWNAISDAISGSVINALAIAPTNPQTIYAARNNGTVYITTNGASVPATWNLRSTGLRSGGISDVVVSPTDAAEAYVSYYDTTGGRIYKTTNTGLTWTNVTGALPSGVAARALAIDWAAAPHHIFIGSGSGVWASLDGGSTWVKDGPDFPNVNVGDLAIDATRRTLTVATYGRGTWRTPLPPPYCPSDFDNGSGTGTPDGGVTIEDMLYYLWIFDLGLIAADIDDGSGHGVADGGVTIDDLLYFLYRFNLGC